MLIGLTGKIAAGKGVINDFFQEKGFVYSSLSTIIREEAEKRGILIERKHLQDLGNLDRRKYGAGIWMRRLLERVDLSSNVVIDGVRNPGEIEELKKQGDFYLISVGAPQKTRYERVVKRGRSSDPKTWEGFLEIDERDFGEEDEFGQQVGKCMQLTDYKLINDGTLEELYYKLNKIYDGLKC